MDMNRPTVESLSMDLNRSMELTNSAPQIHNFMPMTSFMLPFRPPSNVHGEEAERSHLLALKRNLDLFWQQQMMDIHNTSDFKSNHQLPLARIKRIMKSDKDVKMISADTPMLFSKACELFILELTLRAWLKTEQGKRRTLQRYDIARAIRQEGAVALHFLVDAVPLSNNKDDDGNFVEENEYHPVNKLQFPLLDINSELIMRNNEAQQLMMKPPMSSHGLN
ncbi:hypothetical protein GQ457_01G037030 [Hibiscus cannabinus]